MANDLFLDTEMPFTEHLSELQKHLWRAVKWVLLVMVVMTFVGDKVVKILVDPVEKQLRIWYSERLEGRATRIQKEFQDLPEETRPNVEIVGSIPVEEVEKLLKTAAPNTAIDKTKLSPIPLTLKAEIGNLIKALNMPLAELNQPWHLRSLSAQEAFMIYFKAVIGASLIVASPLVFHEIYSFVSVGLYVHERRFVQMTLPFSVCLFLSGVAVCFFLVFPATLTFFCPRTPGWTSNRNFG